MPDDRSPMQAAIGARLRRLRERAGFTQEELASLVGLHKGSVGRHENGHQVMSLADAMNYANALKVSLDTLCGREDDAPSVPLARSQPIYYVDTEAMQALRSAKRIEDVANLHRAGIEIGGEVPASAVLVSEQELGKALIEADKLIARLGGVPRQWLDRLPQRRGDERNSRNV